MPPRRNEPREDEDVSRSEIETSESKPPNKVALPLCALLAGTFVILEEAWVHPVFLVPASAEFGLFQFLPPLYWFGLGLVAVSIALAARTESDLLFAITGAAFLGLLAATPTLFETNAPVFDTYYHWGSAAEINRTGHIPTTAASYASNWPGFFLNVAFANAMGGFPPLEFLHLFPLFSGITTFLALFVFYRAFFSSAVARPASVISALMNVWAQYHVSPQGIGLTLALLVLATAWDRRIPYRLANAVLFLGLVISHATSAIFLLAFFAIDATVSLLIPRRRSETSPSRAPIGTSFNPFLSYAAVWLGWLFFVAGGSAAIARTSVLGSVGGILRIGEETASTLAARTVQNIYIWPPRIRTATLGIFGLVSLVALIPLFRNPGTRSLARFLASGLVGAGILAGADILFFGGLFYDRALMFAAVFMPGLCIFGLRDLLRSRPVLRRTVFVLLLTVSVAAASTAYYQEAFNIVPSQMIAMTQFFTDHSNATFVLDGAPPPLPVWLLYSEPPPFTDVPFYVVYPTSFDSLQGPNASFAVFDPVARLWYVQGHGIEIIQYYELQRSNHSLIYDNGFGKIYLIYKPSG
jgi:hypothetical protein